MKKTMKYGIMKNKIKNKTNKNLPKINLYENIKTYKTDKNGRIKKTTDLTKTIKGKKLIIKGILNKKPINEIKKVKFSKRIISPRKGLITSMKNYIPKSILRI